MTRNDKIAFAIASALRKKLKATISVCRVGTAVEWRTNLGGFAVANIETVSPKWALDKAHGTLSALTKRAGK